LGENRKGLHIKTIAVRKRSLTFETGKFKITTYDIAILNINIGEMFEFRNICGNLPHHSRSTCPLLYNGLLIDAHVGGSHIASLVSMQGSKTGKGKKTRKIIHRGN
jgi:hypothetical protein